MKRARATSNPSLFEVYGLAQSQSRPQSAPLQHRSTTASKRLSTIVLSCFSALALNVYDALTRQCSML